MKKTILGKITHTNQSFYMSIGESELKNSPRGARLNNFEPISDQIFSCRLAWARPADFWKPAYKQESPLFKVKRIIEKATF